MKTLFAPAITGAILFSNVLCSHPALAESAQAILDKSGFQGGLIVHIGVGDGSLTADLRANDSTIVHGLDTDAAVVEQARKAIQAKGLYGTVSLELWGGAHLPYVDNLVNLLVVTSDKSHVTRKEIMRVLAPLGVAYVGDQKIVKPWPGEIDEWTHYLHGADNNAVAKDSVVGPPERYQWIAGPKWARSHDHLSSLSAMVSANGRLFYIIDEAPIASVAFQSQWRLVARDAFNGVLLWKRDIEQWEDQFRQFRTGPTGLAKRLVAVKDRVYVTLGYGKPISILDAASGATIRECNDTDNAMEIAVHDGTICAVVGDRAHIKHEDTGQMATEQIQAGRTSGNPEIHWKVMLERAPLKHLVAIDEKTGKLQWKKNDADTREIMPTAMAVSDGRLFIQNEKAIVALDAGTGKELWRSARSVSHHAPGSSAPTLVAANGVVICADREADTPDAEKDEQGRTASWYMYPHTDHSKNGKAIAYDAATGERLWSVTSVENFRAPADVFVVDDAAYVRSHDPGLCVGIDLRTGTIKRSPEEEPSIKDPATHWRCYRNKATEKYLLLCQGRTEFVDFVSGAQTRNDFVRGACQYGVMPCNGLLYAPFHPCACRIDTQLNSFNALAPHPNPKQDYSGSLRFEKGEAFRRTRESEVAEENGWPTYRGNAARGGAAKTTIGSHLKEAWKTKLGARLTAPVVANGLLITATPDTHEVHALNANTGLRVWTYTAGGAVDSPPTIAQGRAVFGSADGWVYCLRATDGKLAWRYRATPVDRRIVAYGKVESIWPVHGSVLVQDGVVYAVAGRTAQMDGLSFCALDLVTGKKVVEQQVEKSCFPDILSSDGANIFMRQRRFDKQGVVQVEDVPHLFSSAGFLDDTWWHRNYWQYGTDVGSGYTSWFSRGEFRNSGRLLVTDGKRIYGFGRRDQYNYIGSHLGLGKTKYLLYAAELSDHLPEIPRKKRLTAREKRLAARETLPQKTAGKSLTWTDKKPDLPSLWKEEIDLLARGMVLCDTTLFVAGPPDLFGVATGDNPHPYTLAAEEGLEAQREAMDGAKGTLLWALSAETGEKISEYRLDGLPAWDGLIAADNCLYMTMQNGTVMCMKGD